MAVYNERTAGIYRCRFAKLVEDYTFEDKKTGEEVTRWRWVFQETGDPTTAGEIDTLTSPGFRPRSNGLKFLMGMIGGPPPAGFDTNSLIGQEFDVTYGPNQAGTLTIVGVTRPNPTPVAAVAAAHQEPPGDLPF
jgi:hypothetical protein